MDAPAAPGESGQADMVIDGVEVAMFAVVVARLRLAYPHVRVSRIEAVLLREWEAYSAGRPLVVPIAVEEGVREVLEAVRPPHSGR